MRFLRFLLDNLLGSKKIHYRGFTVNVGPPGPRPEGPPPAGRRPM